MIEGGVFWWLGWMIRLFEDLRGLFKVDLIYYRVINNKNRKLKGNELYVEFGGGYGWMI